jgi:acetyl-CoA C-acetyltransferase
VVVGRLEDDDRRFLALTAPDDAETLELLSTGEPIGRRLFVASTPEGNRVLNAAARTPLGTPRA